MKATEPTGGSHRNLGQVIVATRVITSAMHPRRARNIILLLAASVALMMTGFGIIMPVFARRLSEFGSDVETLGLMTTSFAFAQLLASPLMGSLADRFGRRPLVLVALAAHTTANVGYLLASSATAFIIIRAIGGGLTAGLFPSAMSIVADLVPEKQRARWIGIVMGGYGAGFVLGPVAGGVLYDGWGFGAPFVASAVMAAIALCAAFILVPETRPHEVRRREALWERRTAAWRTATVAGAAFSTPERSLLTSLPRPLHIFGTLLFLDFIGAFAFAFFEPQMVFYVYEELGWSTIKFGLVVGAYGLAMMIGQMALGQTSDRFGRKPVIIVGTLLNTTLYVGTAVLRSFPLMTLIAVISGLGAALIAPALNAFYLDITPKQHRSRVVGVKGSALALGSATGPLLLALVSGLTPPQGIFGIAGTFMVISAVLAFVILQEPHRVADAVDGVAWEVSARRAMAAQASLRGIALWVSSTRKARSVLVDSSRGAE